MEVGAVEGIFFTVVIVGFVAWQLWSLRDRK
jgi:hypothetical protein